MRVSFYDRQDADNPRNGATASDPEIILEWLDQTRGRPAFFCELLGDNNCKLLVGISDTLGCVQYGARDGSPPYLMAIESAAGEDGYMDFLTANTDTPVLLRFCLPMERIREVIQEFIRTGGRSSKVNWEEV